MSRDVGSIDAVAHQQDRIRRALTRWLQGKIPDADSVSLKSLEASTSGGSSETWFVNASVATGAVDRDESWVLRIEATEHKVYQFPSVARQYLTMKLLHEADAAPVPKMLWYEGNKDILGESFFLMERVAGEVPRGLVHSDVEGLIARSSAAEREAIWLSALKAMARVHCVDAARFAFLDRPSLGRTALDQEMATWDSYSDWCGLRWDPIQQRARRWLEDNRPPATPHGLAWGDARLGNMVFKGTCCAAILDWETVSLVGAEADLGWWLFYDWFAAEGLGQRALRLEGTPTPSETLKIWEDLAGRRANNIEWFVVLAAWRFSMIRDRAAYLARSLGRQHVPVPDPDPVLIYLAKRIAG